MARGSGGWSSPKEDDTTLDNMPIAQLYDMENDAAETTNLYLERPEIAEKLITTFRIMILKKEEVQQGSFLKTILIILFYGKKELLREVRKLKKKEKEES